MRAGRVVALVVGTVGIVRAGANVDGAAALGGFSSRAGGVEAFLLGREPLGQFPRSLNAFGDGAHHLRLGAQGGVVVLGGRGARHQEGTGSV